MKMITIIFLSLEIKMITIIFSTFYADLSVLIIYSE